MKLLYGTGNPAKLSAMRNRLENLNIELIGLNDMKENGYKIPKVPENGATPLENARQKAKAYYEAFHIPIFSCDSGLYFENVPDEIQPGVHVRNVNGKCLTDEEMLEYYAGLAKRYGNLTAKYKNAICFIMNEDNIYEAMEPSMESEKFIITRGIAILTAANAPSPSTCPINIPSTILYIDIANILIMPGAATIKNSRHGFSVAYIFSAFIFISLSPQNYRFSICARRASRYF